MAIVWSPKKDSLYAKRKHKIPKEATYVPRWLRLSWPCWLCAPRPWPRRWSNIQAHARSESTASTWRFHAHALPASPTLSQNEPEAESSDKARKWEPCPRSDCCLPSLLYSHSYDWAMCIHSPLTAKRLRSTKSVRYKMRANELICHIQKLSQNPLLPPSFVSTPVDRRQSHAVRDVGSE